MPKTHTGCADYARGLTTLTCAWCKKQFDVDVQWGQLNRKYCDENCRKKSNSYTRRLKHQQHQHQRVRVKMGRKCQWCKVLDHEVLTWKTTAHECPSCNRARKRGRQCAECEGPTRKLFGRLYCVRCDYLPDGAVELILLAPGDSTRERVLWRNWSRPRAKVIAKMRRDGWRVQDGDPIVCTPTLEGWRSWRT